MGKAEKISTYRDIAIKCHKEFNKYLNLLAEVDEIEAEKLMNYVNGDEELPVSTTKTSKWTVVFDAGKPYEAIFVTIESLRQALKEFFLAHIDDSYDYDVKIYDADDVDISETQFTEEMIREIMEECESD